MTATLETYKARWEDFRIDCEWLDSARRELFHGYGNEDIGADADELWDRVFAYEARFAHLPVMQRANEMLFSASRYADI